MFMPEVAIFRSQTNKVKGQYFTQIFVTVLVILGTDVISSSGDG
jgi:hypothetical protein